MQPYNITLLKIYVGSIPGTFESFAYHLMRAMCFTTAVKL